MPKKKKIKPTQEGLKVPFPMSNRCLAPDGEMVIWSSYWTRRQKEGSIEEVKEAPKPKATKKKITQPEKTEGDL